jgi:hypothetical protein
VLFRRRLSNPALRKATKAHFASGCSRWAR